LGYRTWAKSGGRKKKGGQRRGILTCVTLEEEEEGDWGRLFGGRGLGTRGTEAAWDLVGSTDLGNIFQGKYVEAGERARRPQKKVVACLSGLGQGGYLWLLYFLF